MNSELRRIDLESGKIPLVTVAMPIYNAGVYLRTAVLSIISQTYSNWQLFIIDDGSTDDALQSLNDIGDNRIKILCDGNNKGLAARLNEAIDLAEGKYFARMDQDDISYPERFEKQVMALESDESLDVVCVKALTISEADQPVGYLPHQTKHEDICAKPWRSFHMP
ncbi:MAG: glycosyltransferase family A protein, partial [Nitrosomonadales bacterium]|nr:glycosyltransferase family A protein [Nitrosomonadales bacterium]